MDNSGLKHSFDELLKIIKKKYHIKNYIKKEDYSNDFSPQSNLIYIALNPDEDISQIVYAYLILQKIHLHLKNYLLKVKKKPYGYKNEFLDIFNDIFIDNFLIFREISKYIKEEHLHYMNIWFDGFFISNFNKLINNSQKKYQKIQPHLFFFILLYLALPRISKVFKEIPFTSVISFHKSTHDAWQQSLKLFDELDFINPIDKKSVKIIDLFLFSFFELSLEINNKSELVFNDQSIAKCIHFINNLINKTDEMINNINKIREEIIKNPV